MAFLFNPLHYALHHAVSWDLADSYSFARNDPWVPLARSDVRRQSQSRPILIADTGGTLVPCVPIAVSDAAIYPLAEDFTWRLGPPPSTLRYHPFQAIDSDIGAPVLAVAVDSKTVSPQGTNRFFDDMARPTALVRAVLRRLQQLRRERQQMADAAAALGQAGLLRPVTELTDRSGRILFRTLDREAFYALSPQRLGKLGDNPRHAFMLAMAMLYSSRFLPGAEAVATEVPVAQPAPKQQGTKQGAPETPVRYEADDDAKLFFNFDQN